MTALTPRAMGVGEILDTGFTLYRRHFLALFLIALLPRIPEILYWIGLTAFVPAESRDIGGLLILPWSFFVTFLTLAALAAAAGAAWEGREPQVGASLREGLSRWLPVTISGVVAYLCVGMGFGLGFGLIALPGGFLFALFLAGAPAGGSVAVLGLVLAIVGGILALVLAAAPALFLLASFFAFAPVATLERTGAGEALTRSWALAKGGRLRILGVTVVAYILVLIPTLAATAGGFFLVGGGTSLFSDDPVAAEGSMVWLDGMIQVAGPVISALVWPLFVTVLVILYLDRRARVDAPELEDALERL